MSEDTDEPVGRGKPPRKTRFKDGQSGNPKGRPKGSKNRKTVLTEIAFEKRCITRGGTRLEASNAELLLLLLHKAAVAGNQKALAASDEFRTYLSPERQIGGRVIVFPEEPASLEEFVREAEAHRAVMLEETEAFRREIEGDGEDGET